MTSVRPKKATNVKWNDSVVTIPEEVPPLDAVNRDAIQTTETPKNDDEQIFNGAAVAAGNDLGTSKWQERLVNLEDRLQAPGLSDGYDIGKDVASSDYVKATAHQVAEAIKANIDVEAIEGSVKGFSQSSKVLMGMLDEVQTIHPFIGVPVLAFKAVVTLELKRRDNDSKIIVLHLKMQEMMSVLLQLREIRQSQRVSNGGTLQEHLQDLMIRITDDIKLAGNVCDSIHRKSFIARVLKSFIYEARLDDCGTKFANRRKELELALLTYTATAIDSASHTLSDVHDNTRSADEKLDMILLFRQLDSPDEKELMKYIESKGGPKECMEDESALRELTTMRRAQAPTATLLEYTHHEQFEPPARTRSRRHSMHMSFYHNEEMSGHERTASSPRKRSTSFSYRPQYHTGYSAPEPSPTQEDSLDVKVLLVALRRELEEDVEESFSRNMLVFQRKFEVQKVQIIEELGRVVRREGDRVIEAVVAGPHDKIVNRDLHSIWKEMAWKRSVKARHLVLAVRDYYAEQYNNTDSEITRHSSVSISAGGPRTTSNPAGGQDIDDQWALGYISIFHVQPILEAFDDDGSGFVSVNEANELTASRPPTWSLPHWIAYWAAGWHLSIWEYRSQIAGILQQMWDLYPLTLLGNRSTVLEYRKSTVLERLELLLLGVQWCPQDANLKRKIASYVQSEETRMEGNLRSVAYELDAPDTVTLITGPGRIERYVFPLLYLLLKRHLRVIKLACHHLLSRAELIPATQSISQILDAVVERIGTVAAVCAQKGHSLQRMLKTFAFGMFQFVNDPAHSDGSPAIEVFEYIKDVEANETDTTILKFGVHDLDRAAYDPPEFDEPFQDIDSSDSIKGSWSGWFFDSGGVNISGLMDMKFQEVTADGQVEGSGVDCGGPFSIYGNMDSEHLKGTVVNDDRGLQPGLSFDLDADIQSHGCVMSGTWSSRQFHLTSRGTLLFTRTPSAVIQFRPTRQDLEANPARKRWLFALSAVRYQVQRRMWSWSFFKTRFHHRRRYVELQWRLNLSEPLIGPEYEEMFDYVRFLSGRDARFYNSLARFPMKGMCIHVDVHCVSCSRTIIGTRTICTECHVDMCSKCSDLMPVRDGPRQSAYYSGQPGYYSGQPGYYSGFSFYHDPRHTVVQVRQVLDIAGKAKLIATAREVLSQRRESELTGDNQPVNGEVVASNYVAPPSIAASISRSAELIVADETASEIAAPSISGNVSGLSTITELTEYNETTSEISKRSDVASVATPGRRCICCNDATATWHWSCVYCPAEMFACDACDAVNEMTDPKVTGHESHSVIRVNIRPLAIDPIQTDQWGRTFPREWEREPETRMRRRKKKALKDWEHEQRRRVQRQERRRSLKGEHVNKPMAAVEKRFTTLMDNRLSSLESHMRKTLLIVVLVLWISRWF